MKWMFGLVAAVIIVGVLFILAGPEIPLASTPIPS